MNLCFPHSPFPIPWFPDSPISQLSLVQFPKFTITRFLSLMSRIPHFRLLRFSNFHSPYPLALVWKNVIVFWLQFDFNSVNLLFSHFPFPISRFPNFPVFRVGRFPIFQNSRFPVSLFPFPGFPVSRFSNLMSWHTQVKIHFLQMSWKAATYYHFPCPISRFPDIPVFPFPIFPVIPFPSFPVSHFPFSRLM